MTGITNRIAFTVDTAALEKMAREAAWAQGLPGTCLHEISVTEDGLVCINGKPVFDPCKVIEQRKSESEAMVWDDKKT